MNSLAQIATVIDAIVLIAIGPLESLLIGRGWTQRMLGVGPLDANAVRHVHLWSFNIGARNVLVGVGALIGIAMYHHGDSSTGTTVTVVCLVYMLASSLLMGVCDAPGFWEPRGGSVRGTASSAILPAAALIAIAAG